MIDEIFFAWTAIWQEQTTAVAMYLAGYAFWKGYIVLVSGSSIGIIICYFFPDYTKWLGQRTVESIETATQRRLRDTRLMIWCQHYWLAIEKARARLIDRIVANNYPQLIVFASTAIPIPFLWLAPIAATRILKLRRGFTIVYSASVVRSLIIALVTYRVLVTLK